MHNLVGLLTLTADEGSLAILKPDQLNDGPWCGGGDNEFDADLHAGLQCGAPRLEPGPVLNQGAPSRA